MQMLVYIFHFIRKKITLNQKLKAPVQRRTNWRASDLGKGNTMNEVN